MSYRVIWGIFLGREIVSVKVLWLKNVRGIGGVVRKLV